MSSKRIKPGENKSEDWRFKVKVKIMRNVTRIEELR
jgi:hypothetical protein